MWGVSAWPGMSNEGFVPSTVLGDGTGPETGHLLFDSEPITAYRAWRLDDTGRMRSVSWGIHWPVRKPMRAHCLTAFNKLGYKRFSDNPHACPFLGHSCGIYGVLEPDTVNGWGSGPLTVRGTVLMWGRVLRFEKGFRSEYAYPAGFFELESADYDVRALANLYGVQVL